MVLPNKGCPMTLSVPASGRIEAPVAAFRRRPERMDRPSAWAALPAPRRLLLVSVVILALLITSVIAGVWVAVGSIDAAAITAEQKRASAALDAVLDDGPALDAALALRLEREFSLSGARFLTAGAASGLHASVPVPGIDGVTLAWEPRRLGSEMALLLAPLRLAVSLVFLAGVGWLVFRLYRLAAELEEQRQAAQQLALRDPLTGLGNRLAFDEGLERFYRLQGSGALLYLDLDDFKRVNDSLGHAAGDELLRELAARLSKYAGEGDVCARIGGDEFALLLSVRSSRAEVAEVASDIALSIGAPVLIGSSEVSVGTCIGIALIPSHGGDAAELLRAADGALYRAKALGDGCFLFAGDADGGPNARAAAG